MKELAYGAGHEINNPLANISTRAQTLLRDEKDPERRRMLATINRQAFRAHEMIADLMLFARPPAISRKQVELNELADRVVGELEGDVEQRAIAIVRKPSSAVNIDADPTQIAVLLRAIIVNAIEAIGSGGTIEVDVQSTPAGAQIVVSDNGPGMDERCLAHLFDPFFSGREAGRGLGLGLSKCWQIVKSHGGEITVESQPGRGAVFAISLPTSFNPEPTA
jgi:signal transduction histidine kinase